VQHVGTDIDANDKSFRAHMLGGALGHGSGAGPEVEDALSRRQLSPRDHAFHDRGETLVDLAQVDARHAIPHADLPRQPR
jgi:hypothetical protein